MDLKNRLHSFGIGRKFCAISIILGLSCGLLFAQDGKGVSTPQSLRVITLKNITVQQGREYLCKLGITNVSQLPGSNTVLVTDSPRQLIKATAVLDLVDGYEKYAIETVFTIGQDKPLPSNNSIETQVGDILIGTFANVPVRGDKQRVIIDFHDNGVVAVAPAAQMDKIIKVIAQLQKEAKDAAKRAAKLFKEQKEAQQEQTTVEEANQSQPAAEFVKSGSDSNSEPKLQAIPAVETTKALQKEPFENLLQLLDQAEKSSKQQKLGATPVADNSTETVNAQQSQIIELPENLSLGQLLDLGMEHLQLNYIYDVNQVDTTMPLDIKGNVTVSELYSLIESMLKINGFEIERNENFVSITPIPKGGKDGADSKMTSGSIDIDTDTSVAPDKTYIYEPNDINNGNDELILELPEKLEIIHLLRLAGEYLKLDYMYDPAKVKGEVYLSLYQSKIKVKELYPLMQRALAFNGFVMSRYKNIVTIVPVADADSTNPDFISDNQRPDVSDIVVKKVFRLNYIDTQTAETLLTHMKLGISYASVPARGILIVTGYTHLMPKIDELLKIIDTPGKKKQYRFRVMQHTVAVNLLPRVQSLATQLGAVSIMIETTAAAPGGQETPGMPNAMMRSSRLPNVGNMQPNMPIQNNSQVRSVGQTGNNTPAGDSVYLEADERTNRILMIGLSEQLDIVEKLIDSLDLEQQDLRVMQSYEIQHADAAEVIEKLGELGIINASSANTNQQSSNRLSARPAVAGGPGKETPDAMQASDSVKVLEEPLVIVIASTNSLLVKATVQQHQEIASIISYIDREQLQDNLPYVVYQLENQDPNVLCNTLAQLIRGKTGMSQDSATMSGGPMSSMPGQENMNQTKFAKPNASATTPVARNNAEDITIVPDGKTRSIIVYANKQNQQWIKSMIKELDGYMPQVLLDVTLVQVTKNDDFQFDLDLLRSIPEATLTTGGDGANSMDTILAKLNAAKKGGKNLGDSAFEARSEAGQFTAFYGDNKINALLNTMQFKNYGRVMDRPKLLVNDGEKGTIKATTITYVKKIEHNYQPTDNNNGGYSTETITYPEYEAGITLNITPAISAGDMLKLNIEIDRSAFISKLTGEIPPNKVATLVGTQITVPNGHTIILGGMEKANSAKGGSKVPILGDLPLIGGLFREVSEASSQDKLYIFVKAHILRPGEELGLTDLRNVSDKDRKKFENIEGEMQEYKTWPGIKAKPMDPVKILEAN